MDKIKLSDNDKWKYMTTTPNGKTLYFGKKTSKHFTDRTPMCAYSYMNDYDQEKRHKYQKKLEKKRGENGVLLTMNQERREYYESTYLN